MTVKHQILVWGAAGLYVSAGALHFAKADLFARIVPPSVPWPVAAVYVSGAAEIAGGAGLLIAHVRRFAAFGLAALLILVFPANVYMAVANIPGLPFSVPRWLLWLRLPVQALLVWWVLAIARMHTPNPTRD